MASDVAIGDETGPDGMSPGSVRLTASVLSQDSVAVTVNVKRPAREPKPGSGPPRDSVVMIASAQRRDKAETKDNNMSPARGIQTAVSRRPDRKPKPDSGPPRDRMVMIASA